MVAAYLQSCYTYVRFLEDRKYFKTFEIFVNQFISRCDHNDSVLY